MSTEPPRSARIGEMVGEALLASGWRIGVAESCTGGLVAKCLTDTPGASRYLVGGVVAYADQVKETQLSVPSALLRKHGAVSGEVALAMAEGVRRALGVEVGLSVTGIAGPGGAVGGKPVGTVWFGVVTPRGSRSDRVHFPGTREEIRERSAQHALHLVLESVREGEGGPNPGDAGG